MSDIDYKREEERRYRMETSKERSILIRNWLYTGMAVIVCIMLVWSLYAWKMTSNVTAATSAKLNGILDKLDAKVDAVDTTKINDLIDGGSATLYAVKQRVDDLKYTQDQLNKSIAVLRDDSVEVKAFIAKLGGVADEAQAQIHSNGTATAQLVTDTNTSVNDHLLPEVTESMKATRLLMDRFGATADETTQALKLASDKLGVSLDALYALISSSEWKETLTHIDATAANVEATTGQFAEASKNAPSIAASLEKIARTSSKFARVTLIANIISTLARGFLP